jgi:hypothetical protein
MLQGDAHCHHNVIQTVGSRRYPKFEVLKHSSRSSHLAPSDRNFFGVLTDSMRGRYYVGMCTRLACYLTKTKHLRAHRNLWITGLKDVKIMENTRVAIKKYKLSAFHRNQSIIDIA